MSTAAPSAPPVKKKPKSLFAKHTKIYPKSVSGFYRRLKWGLLIVFLGIYYILPWLRWDRGPGVPDQAVLLDLETQRFYLFFVELWPQQIYYLTGALILAAVGLFLATSLAGRIWCGYACPQTVWTDLYVWVERLIEGERNDRIRLDQGPNTLQKIGKKILKHSIWMLIGLGTGGAAIFYFLDAPTFWRDLMSLQASETALWFVLLFTLCTYVMAGFAREQMCIYMCPWPRFQVAMIDEESLIVTYQDWRGEGRAPVRKSQSWEERTAEGLGDCIDCYACYQACPTGVDIRDGLQVGCIGCGLCIDACDDIMDRIGRPRGLVKFDTQTNQISMAETRQKAKYHLFRPRTIIYTTILLGIIGAMAIGLVMRPGLKVSVLRDRAPLYVTLSDGSVRNAYTFKISNMTREHREYELTAVGVGGAGLSIAGGTHENPAPSVRMTAGPDTVATYRVLATAGAGEVKAVSVPLRFVLVEKGGERATYETVFMGPAN
jgi:cytochrome c oxidase accessory protein FixG